ncbi:chloramphenical resistance permease RarD [Brenneria alni]|uniref:Chloramphenical resistance permease RarD n=1 Tax=Brenneria alni TaxID=71656 RepID=A0A421DL78_9GAMM|nr:EamA family transporter RarD [Brenneria alni]RLM20716.1 chloramphenical resistance permease RarD [Brenneria alni]
MDTQQTRKGIFFALGAYFIWGIAPVYFKLLEHVPADEILTHRIIWSFFFMLILLTISRKWRQVRYACRNVKHLLLLALTAVLIGGNWLLYIWAVNNHHMLEASLGYFINPLVNVILGMLFFGERFRRLQWFAVLLAVAGVFVQLWAFGSLPIIALTLAFSFAVYGLLRKKIGIDGQTGMLIETLWLLPIAIVYLFFIADTPSSHLIENAWSLNLLLMSAGIITTVPLLFFTAAAMRLPLSTLGFFQYLGPTMMFLLAVIFYGETFGNDKLITFVFIWSALALFILDALYTQRKRLQIQITSRQDQHGER